MIGSISGDVKFGVRVKNIFDSGAEPRQLWSIFTLTPDYILR